MKEYRIFLLIIIILFFVNCNLFLDTDEDSYTRILRSLWESDMDYDSKDDYGDSLEHCSRSSHKYFSYIKTGAPVTFDHTVNEHNVVRINNLYNNRIL